MRQNADSGGDGLDSGQRSIARGSVPGDGGTERGTGGTLPTDGASPNGKTVDAASPTHDAGAPHDIDAGADPWTYGTACASASVAACWYGPGWNYRRRITIPGARVSGDHTHFPVLVTAALPEWKSTANGGHVARVDGGDLVFTAEDAVTKLDHEIEGYTAATGQLVAWVKVPILSASKDTVLHVYYGNASSTDQQSPVQVWDDGGSDFFRGVWHMAETGVSPRLDSTKFANHCVVAGYEGDEATSGVSAGADQLDGVDDTLNCGADASLNLRAALTVSAWIRPSSRPLLDEWYNGPWKTAYGLYLFGWSDTETYLGVDFYIDGQRQDTWTRGTTDIAPNAWVYVAATYDGTYLRAYVNGALEYSLRRAGTLDDSSATSLTFSNPEGGNAFLHGALDEVRVSSVARSAPWIATAFNNQSNPATFISVGVEEPRQQP